jgi:hypothetical protein
MVDIARGEASDRTVNPLLQAAPTLAAILKLNDVTRTVLDTHVFHQHQLAPPTLSLLVLELVTYFSDKLVVN